METGEESTIAREWNYNPQTARITITDGNQLKSGKRAVVAASKSAFVIDLNERPEFAPRIWESWWGKEEIEIISDRKTPLVAKQIFPKSKIIFKAPTHQGVAVCINGV